jgi:carbamoylphosphate synthase small subunit
MSVQFHPEAYPGPVDSGVLFDEFVRVLRDA